MRLIDADALKEAWKDVAVDGATLSYIYGLFKSVDDAPTIDAKLHGVWKTAKDGKYGCSVCGLPAPGGGLTSFCPNCGAKMDGERSEE